MENLLKKMTDFKHKAILYSTIVILLVTMFTMIAAPQLAKVDYPKVIVPEKKGEF
jgi:hypothetical protein